MADVKISGLPASTVPLAGTEVLPIVQGGTTKQVSIANVTAGRSVAALSVITPTIQAEAGSAGGTIKNGSGVAQMQWGSGGASNLSLEVATNINPANAAVSISPTGTGTVTISPAGALTINPTAASTINNTSIGATTASTGRFTSVTATTGNVVIGTSGQGVDFSATPGTGTSELFADYEEGTWTPIDSSGAGLTFTVNGSSTYTKIGRFVEVSCALTFPVTADVSQVTIGGLPFTSKNVTTNMQGGNTTFTNRGTWAMPLVTSNSTTATFHNLDGTNATNVSFSTRILRFAVYYSV